MTTQYSSPGNSITNACHFLVNNIDFIYTNIPYNEKRHIILILKTLL